MKAFLIASLLLWPSISQAAVTPRFGLGEILKYDQFSHYNCKEYHSRRVCTPSEEAEVRIIAELEQKDYKKRDRFWLTVIQSNGTKRTPAVQEYLVSFKSAEGVRIEFKRDFYEQFETVHKGPQIDMATRLWLLQIMRSLRPGYNFNFVYQ